jgi:TM2 domain-containing membrane protein YozV
MMILDVVGMKRAVTKEPPCYGASMDLGLFILRLTRLFRQRPSKQWLYALLGVAVVVAVCVAVEAMGWWPAEWMVAPRFRVPR